MHPYMNCDTCDPKTKEACNYPDTGICAKEATLPPAVCPMFEVPTNSNNVAAKVVAPP